MGIMENYFDEMRIAVLEGEEDRAVELAKFALSEKMDLLSVMNEGFLKGIMEAGQLYEDGDYFLPELVCAADAMKAALAVLDEELKKDPAGSIKKGTVLTATVQGDVHDIGKTIVGALLTAGGFEVCDLGADVKNEEIIKAVREKKPDIVGLSAMLTTTMEVQKTVIELLKAEGLLDSVKVIVGGAPVSREWSEKIGADGYSDNAINAVKLANQLLA